MSLEGGNSSAERRPDSERPTLDINGNLRKIRQANAEVKRKVSSISGIFNAVPEFKKTNQQNE